MSGEAPKRMPVLSRAAWVLEHMVAFPDLAGEPGQAVLFLPVSWVFILSICTMRSKVALSL